MTTYSNRSTYVASSLLALLLLLAGSQTAFANHPNESEGTSPSHAESVEHEHDDDAEDHSSSAPIAVTISAPAGSTAQLQQLLAAMMQLVELLQKQQEMIEHDATPHTHDEDEDHDQHTNEEDHA